MRVLAILALVLPLCLAWGRALTPEVEDSLHLIHPRLRAHWLKERGIDYPGLTSPLTVDSENMTCVGRWTYGSAYDVAGQIRGNDTIIFLARGSGVSVLQFHGGPPPNVSRLSDIDAVALVTRVVVEDSWLFVGSSGFEIYNVARPTNPVKASWTNMGINDLAVQDSFLYTTSGDSFTVFNIADKANPRPVGFCPDSGSTIAVSGNNAFLLWGTYGWHGMYILDISNPAAPHRVGVWSGTLGSVAAQRNLCYVCDAGSLHILNVANPSSPQELSSVDVGGNMYLDGNYAYLSSYAVVDVTDSLMPGIVGQCTLNTEATSGLWGTGLSGKTFVACGSDGLAIVDQSDPVHPVVDSIGIIAYDASDGIFVQGGQAIVANHMDGAKLLNVEDPTHPYETASLDTAGEQTQCTSVRLAGPLAYVGWFGQAGWRGLYVVSFADTAGPVILDKCATVSPVYAMATRDSFLYAGCITSFQVLGIADSMHPESASTCTLGFLASTNDVCVSGNVAYVANMSSGLRMIDISQPRAAAPVGIYLPPQAVFGVVLRDTIAYVTTGGGLRIVNVRDPSSPQEIKYLPVPGGGDYVALKGNLIFISGACEVLDISDPANPRELGFWQNGPRSGKVFWGDSLIYLTDYDDGVIILKYYGPDGCSETDSKRHLTVKADLSVFPNPTSGMSRVKVALPSQGTHVYRLFDPSGRSVRQVSAFEVRGGTLDLRRFETGIYFLKDCTDGSLCRITLVR